jgi:hypothetical protein
MTVIFSELQRSYFRDALGFSPIFRQSDPRLETAIDSLQSTSAPGGTRPDDTSAIEALSIVADIQTIYCNMKNMWPQLAVMRVDKTHLDAARGIIMLRSEGRRLVTRLSALLSTNPRRDIFSASQPNLDGDAFANTTGTLR